jgi:hypothetical protein
MAHPSRGTRLRRTALLVALVAMAVAAATASSAHAEEAPPAGSGPAPAQGAPTSPDETFGPALCSGHAVEFGDWVNADPNARGIARIELRDCQSVTTCSGNTCTTTHDAGWTTHAFGSCSPGNCDWGWSAGTFRLSSGQIYGYYDQGFAKRHVYAKMSQYRPGQLWVYWRTDFVDPNRPDYDLHEWFVRA